MQININELSLAKVFNLSQLIKEKCKNKTNFEEVAQELMKTLSQTIVTGSGNSAIVLSRLFKSCSYSTLTEDIQDYIKQSEGTNVIPLKSKYLTLLGTWGELEEWRYREKSKSYKAFSLNDKNVLYKFPMLSAVFNQIGYKTPTINEPDKSIIVDRQNKEYGVFYVKDATESKFVPKQEAFVMPYGVKSVIGFGGHYENENIYAIIIFFREYISEQDAKLFLSLNPTLKFLTLRHEMTGRIFDTEKLADSKINRPSVDLREKNDKLDFQKVESEIRNGEAMAIADELVMANSSLSSLTEELEKKNALLVEEIAVRKQMEGELIKLNTKLQMQDNLKSEFLSTVSHEIRTPLAVILGFATLINKYFKNVIYPNVNVVDNKVEQTLAKVHNDFDIIFSEGKRVTGLLDVLLDMSKIESGKADWNMEDVSVVEIVEWAIKLTSGAHEQKNLKMIKDFEDKLPVIVADRSRLEQIMVNLISNAIKFTDKGSVTCRARKQDSEIVISVIDTGAGIEEAFKERIFEKFSQARDQKGAGLGLSICKQIVDYHGGRIWVESKQGKGSNFSFSIPYCSG